MVILTGGIDLSRFKENPVMFYNHDKQKAESLIGKWDNVRIEGNQLMADADIDNDDEFSKKISGKVERGYLKGASIGLDFSWNDVNIDFPGFEGVPVVLKCELLEASITPLPGNKKALKLYADGQLLEGKESVTLHLNKIQKPTLNNMQKLQLFAAALSLTFTDKFTEDHALEGVKTLAADRDSLKTEKAALELKIKELNDKLALEADSKVNKLIEDALTAKKFSVTEKDHFTKLAKQDFETTSAIISKMTPATSILGNLNKGGEPQSGSKFEGWDWTKLHKEAPEELARIKKDDPEKFKQLYHEKYGVNPSV